jgi:hypothetical protein
MEHLDGNHLLKAQIKPAAIASAQLRHSRVRGFDRVSEGPAFGMGAAVLALQPVIPFCLGVGVVDQRERWIEAQPLANHDVAVLVQKGRSALSQGQVDAVVDLAHPVANRIDRGQLPTKCRPARMCSNRMLGSLLPDRGAIDREVDLANDTEGKSPERVGRDQHL